VDKTGKMRQVFNSHCSKVIEALLPKTQTCGNVKAVMHFVFVEVRWLAASL
jgi:hypothetical protein